VPSGSTGTSSRAPSRNSSRWEARQSHGSGVGDGQAAVGADQLQLVAAGQVEADVELGEDVAGHPQGGGQAQVDPAGAVGDLVGVHPLGLAGEQADAADAVAAEVAERAAAELDRAADVARLDADAEGSPRVREPPDGAVGDQPAGQGGLGVVASGFSHSTCLPAASALTVHSACSDTGRGT
jgi:hypothetical protein